MKSKTKTTQPYWGAETSIVDLHVPTNRELAEADLIGWLEHELEEERRVMREAADANGWALHLFHVETSEAPGQGNLPRRAR